MPRLSITAQIVAIVTLVLGATALLLLPARYSGEQVIDRVLASQQVHDGVLIRHLFEQHLEGIARTTAVLAGSPGLIRDAANRDTPAVKARLARALETRAGDHIQALAVQLQDGPLALAQGATLFNIYLPLADLSTNAPQTDTWTALTTTRDNRNFHLLRLSLPIISDQFGEVLGYLYAFVVLNDNFALLSQIQSLAGARAVSLYDGDRRLGAIGQDPTQLSLLDNTRAPTAPVDTPSGIVEWQTVNLEKAGLLTIRLLKDDGAATRLRRTFGHWQITALSALLLAGLLLILLLRRQTLTPLHALQRYVSTAADSDGGHRPPASRVPEYERLGKSLEAQIAPLRRQLHEVESLLLGSPALVFGKDADLRYTRVSAGFAGLFGLDPRQMQGKSDEELLPVEIAAAFARDDNRVPADGTPLPVHYRIAVPGDPVHRYVAGVRFQLTGPHGRSGIGGLLTELTALDEAAAQLPMISELLDRLDQAVAILDERQRLLIFNDAYRRLCEGVETVMPECTPDWLVRQPEILQTLARSGRWQGEALLPDGNGQRPIWLSIGVLARPSGGPERSLMLITDLRQAPSGASQLEFLARHDALTGLPNRQMLLERLELMLAQSSRARTTLALLFLDLDRFRSINENLGHTAGDALLRETAHRLSTCLRPGDTLARLGSDEFCVLVGNLPDASSSQHVARRIQQEFASPFRVEGRDLMVSCSIGIALSPDDTCDAPTLLRQADAAAHHVKQRGRNAIQFYDDEVNRRVQQRSDLDEGLRQALNNNELYVEYQPRFDIRGRRVLGVEALVRWTHPRLGRVPPSTFVPLAEESGMILELGWRVLREACIRAREWNRTSPYPIPVSVNLSPRQLRDPELIPDLCDALQHSGLPPRLLELEITETVVIEDIDRVLGLLSELRDIGISISVDDFGTGYSSLIYLNRLPVDTVKIDRSFVADLSGRPDDGRMIGAIISMAHSLGLRVVAEGVETERQRAVLETLGCDELQGFLLARPGPADTVTQLAQRAAQREA